MKRIKVGWVGAEIIQLHPIEKENNERMKKNKGKYRRKQEKKKQMRKK